MGQLKMDGFEVAEEILLMTERSVKNILAYQCKRGWQNTASYHIIIAYQTWIQLVFSFLQLISFWHKADILYYILSLFQRWFKIAGEKGEGSRQGILITHPSPLRPLFIKKYTLQMKGLWVTVAHNGPLHSKLLKSTICVRKWTETSFYGAPHDCFLF